MHVRALQRSAESSSGGVLAGALASLSLALAGCGPSARPAAPPAPVAAPAQASQGLHYRLDPGRSDLRILVFRGGPLARLGHSHVLVASGLSGELWLGTATAPGRFEVTVPVAGLLVDAPAARAAEGEEFASVPSAADVEGTRRHLLEPGQLDAVAYPTLRVSGTLSALPGSGIAHALVEVKARVATLEVPVEASLAADGALSVSGGFSVLQSALGLVPYSVGLGALQVRDELQIRFRLVAVADSGAAARIP